METLELQILQKQANETLNIQKAWSALKLTALHPGRCGHLTPISTERGPAEKAKIELFNDENGKIYFKIIHNVGANGIGVIDTAIAPDINNLKNLIKILKNIEDGVWE